MIWLGAASTMTAALLCLIFRPNGDIAAFIQHPASAAWAQALGAMVAVFLAWSIARSDHRENEKRLRDAADARREAVKGVLDECVEVLVTLNSKAAGVKFSAANVGASIEVAGSMAGIIAALPTLSLDRQELGAITKTRAIMATAERRATFIRDHIRAKSDWAHIEFATLLKQVRKHRGALDA